MGGSLTVWKYALLVSYLAAFSSCCAVAAVLIDDSPLSQDEILAEAPMIGYRPFPKNALIPLDSLQNRWALDAAVLYDAAANDTDLKQRAGATDFYIKSLSAPE